MLVHTICTCNLYTYNECITVGFPLGKIKLHTYHDISDLNIHVRMYTNCILYIAINKNLQVQVFNSPSKDNG